jgi:hypothetical protein
MDKKTQEQRRLNKLAARKSAEKKELIWSDFGTKSYGKANAPTERTPIRQCDHIEGGKVIWIRRNRVNPQPGEKKQYMIPVTKGGLRCPDAAISGKKCLAHLASGGSK